MTDELTPEREAAISRLLAEARHDEPIPADVAARLDAVLGDLSADDLEVVETAPSVGTVTDLAGVRHRRRNAGRLLLAAAAVVVGGVAVGQNLGDRAGSDDADSSAADGAGSLEAPREGTANEAGGASADGEKDDASAPEVAQADGSAEDFLAARLLDDLNTPLELTADNFEVEVQRNLSGEPGSRRTASLADLDAVSTYAATTLFTCADADYGDGARLPAYFDDQEAVLVLRPPEDGVQRVDLLECGTADEIATTDLPAR